MKQVWEGNVLAGHGWANSLGMSRVVLHANGWLQVEVHGEPLPEMTSEARVQVLEEAVRSLLAREALADMVIAAIRRITVDMPDDQANWPAEQALLDLEKALGAEEDRRSFRSAIGMIAAARKAAARLCEALADDEQAANFFAAEARRFAEESARLREAKIVPVMVISK